MKLRNMKMSESIFGQIRKVSESLKHQKLNFSESENARVFKNRKMSKSYTCSGLKIFWHSPIPTSFGFEGFRHFQILTFSGFERFWHLPVSKDSDIFRLWPYPVSKDSDIFRLWHFPVLKNADIFQLCRFQIRTSSGLDMFSTPLIF